MLCQNLFSGKNKKNINISFGKEIAKLDKKKVIEIAACFLRKLTSI